METITCERLECNEPVSALRLCAAHYQSERKSNINDPCQTDGCNNFADHPTTGLCHRCHERLRLSKITATCSAFDDDVACTNKIVNITFRLCISHYAYYRQSLLTDVCRTEGCERIVCSAASDLCQQCSFQERIVKKGAVCVFEGCDRLVQARHLCPGHYRQQRAGESLSPLRDVRAFGTGNIDNGYIMMVRGGIRKGEHRWVMEGILGRELLPGESVHHKNGQRNDNHPENLELWAKPQPTGARVSDLLEWAHEVIFLYEHAPKDDY